MKRLVIFDLDGTLINTMADIVASTNYALAKNGFPVHKAEAYRFFVGSGINTLFERALPEGEKTDENILKARKDFLCYYDKHNTDLSQPYTGIPELLEELQNMGILLAVASNKYQAATEKLIAHYFPNISFSVVLGQREGVPIKPDQAIVNSILLETCVEKENTIYIGDSGVDMQTANNSGVDGIGVTWGFRPRSELVAFNPKHIVNKVNEIILLVN